MTWLEMRSNLKGIEKTITNRLKQLYQYKEMSDGIQFMSNKGRPFNVFLLGNKDPFGCFVIEHEDTGEDGDSYYPGDYNSFEDMLQAMLKEIEG